MWKNKLLTLSKVKADNLLINNHYEKIKRTKRIDKATRGLLATDHVILNHGQVTWTTPELAPSSNYHTNGRTFQLSTDLTCIAALHGGSLVVQDSNP
ncbi:hypothetical protein TNCV_3186801 [Trichonephila clavipes]|nr:hypothetical protein TNCV_3186801 [Trichonephila clavipes]